MSSRTVLRVLRGAPLPRAAVLLAVAASAALPQTAASMGAATVAPGSNLSEVAAAHGVSLARLAAANGLPWDGHVVAGQTLRIPPADGMYTGPNGETLGYATSSGAAAAPNGPAPAAPVAPAASSAPAANPSSGQGSASGSALTVSTGDTLSALALRIGTSVQALAAANGITNPNLILAGTTLKATTPGTTPSPAPSAVASAAEPQTGVGSSSSTGPEGAPAASGSGAGTTAERVTSQQVAQIAGQHGVPGSLAAAIAWQESGNNNALVSSAGARGVMQIMPGTWDWIDASLASPKLQTHSAADNVRAGSLFLRQLLRETGGDEATAIAGYYQGLGSVRERGMYDDTQQYVRNVQALKARFGG